MASQNQLEATADAVSPDDDISPYLCPTVAIVLVWPNQNISVLIDAGYPGGARFTAMAVGRYSSRNCRQGAMRRSWSSLTLFW